MAVWFFRKLRKLPFSLKIFNVQTISRQISLCPLRYLKISVHTQIVFCFRLVSFSVNQLRDCFENNWIAQNSSFWWTLHSYQKGRIQTCPTICKNRLNMSFSDDESVQLPELVASLGCLSFLFCLRDTCRFYKLLNFWLFLVHVFLHRTLFVP